MTTVAIAHDYLTQRGGAERVVLSMLRAFPDATIYTTLYDPDGTYPEFRDARIVTSPLNRIGFFRRHHRAALPLLALAARTLRIEEDVVIASSSGWAHGFNARGKRLVYCHAPARWIYQTDAYLGSTSRVSVLRWIILALRPALARWDRRHARKATAYLANSRIVRDRILDSYGIASEVLPAPHSLGADSGQEGVAEIADWGMRGYHLIVSRLLPYKNVDSAIRAFAALPTERLVIVGSGPERDALRRVAGVNIRMLEDLTDNQLRWVYAHASMLIAPSLEDFGLTPLEAGAYGVPTLALRAGGYLDTVVEGVTGSFFEEPSPEAIRRAVIASGAHAWDRTAISEHASTFSEERFAEQLQALVRDL